jgi:hypothetical protein
MLPFMVINDLRVRVVTSNDDDAGTDNHVYFDIGPIGWELWKSGSQFEAGSDETYKLAVPDLSLTTDDIVWLRLHKKGLGDKAGMPDGIGGNWKPQSIHLLVNGKEWVSVKVNKLMTSSANYWQHDLRPTWSSERRFARTTRLRPNLELTYFQETVAALTTPVKLQGISGWLDKEFQNVCAVGTVIREPGRSTDGLATIDLKLALLDVGGRRYRFDQGHGVRGPRYIRVEFIYGLPIDAAGINKYVPSKGQCVRICGRLKWDTDNEGWYEIHPPGLSDVKVIGAGACGVAGLPGPAKLSLRAAVKSDFPGADLSRGLKALDPCLGTATFSVRDLIKSASF